MSNLRSGGPVVRRRSFGSDNHAAAHPAVLAMLVAVNEGDAPAYGADPWTEQTATDLSKAFGAHGGVFFVGTGSAANVLGLSLLLRPYEGVVCPATAHINVDECGATERILGNKLLTVPTPDGKLTPALVEPWLAWRGDEHRVQPRVVAIAQATEQGTCYTRSELRELRDFCSAHALRLYIDGARLANAAAHLDCSLADLAGYADVLSFGATKNGALAAEAVVVMREGLGTEVPFLRKQQMQLVSKMRYVAAQFAALLEDGLWLRNAQHANAMALRLAKGLRGTPGVQLCQPVQSNAVFACLDTDLIERLLPTGQVHVWDARARMVRWMTAYNTTEADVDALVGDIRQVAAR
ncbi:MAG TPA: beta-eliminating lyase-related protein [Streptosporangiaceae bacterium]|nr:beta-eliminating lyase-related protein [Streptosporangiaceae bacterium]